MTTELLSRRGPGSTSPGRSAVASRRLKQAGPTLFSSHDHVRTPSQTLPVTARRSDSELARGVADGDQSSLRELYDRFGGGVLAMARNVLRNPTLAEDVVQETFLSFWDSPGGFDPDRGSLKTYLLTIAHRRAVDLVRSEESRTRREQIPPDPDYTDVEGQIVTKASSDIVRQALEDLDENERTAIVMAYFGGLTYVEVANSLGAPEGTVKSRIRTGMRKLAVNLKGMEL